ncbi:capsule biosynthesis protein [Psittacicella gerlachiana]|uniref:Capsular polysaccharide export protein n=1 Tax=Psittacicella gerlachiana TaxID=2028574 RepID=A0A3A1YEA3_9GAMM|nr:capsular biosynthesis protein [Psittacicella gerlachiana]RIY35579.1 hypothetical protein CKF59_03470 [Psittacicella gerlachiana]
MTTRNLRSLIEKGDRFLLLQGPIGDFFAKLSLWLQAQGKEVTKINLNGGDEFFYPSNKFTSTYAYHDQLSSFKEYLQYVIKKERIDTLVCFGDCRIYHQIAKEIAQTLNLRFWVFEEGYYRPFYITLEEYGVNAYSHLPREAEFYLEQSANLSEKPEVQVPPAGFFYMAKVAIIYYFFLWWQASEFKYYQHHRSTSLLFYALSWLKAGFRYWSSYLPEKFIIRKVENREYGKFYIFPLQVAIDSQIKVHSKERSVAAYLGKVLVSFAQHAPKDVKLIVKHHPMDRGFTNYKALIKQYLKEYPQLRGRVRYIQNIPLPILMRKAQGVVVVNSTSGLSSLIHNLPTYTLGDCAYDFARLTHQGSLESFWRQPQAPEPQVEQAYNLYHLYHTQINGNFYTQVFLPHHKLAEDLNEYSTPLAP